MKKVVAFATIEFSATLTLTETELHAMEALVAYGDDAFLKVFGEKLGESYMRNHAGGLKSVFAAIRRDVLPAMGEVRKVRNLLNNINTPAAS